MGKYEAKKTNTDQNAGAVRAEFLQYLHDLVYIMAVVLLVLTFFVRIVVVSGSSMFDTLTDGDYLLLINNPLCGELEHGDIVVAAMDRFKNGEPIVKRVIATEGQTVDIDFEEGYVYVDGQMLSEDYTYTLTTIAEGMTFPLVVEEGCVFLMGDNRNDSLDSRSTMIGQVDTREILGKAVFLLVPGTGDGRYSHTREWNRIGGLG